MSAWQLLFKFWCKSDGRIQQNVIYVKKQSSLSSAQEGWNCFPQLFLDFSVPSSLWCHRLQGHRSSQLLAHVSPLTWDWRHCCLSALAEQTTGKIQESYRMKKFSSIRAKYCKVQRIGRFRLGHSVTDAHGSLWGSSSFCPGHAEFVPHPRSSGGFFRSAFEQNNSVPCNVLM